MEEISYDAAVVALESILDFARCYIDLVDEDLPTENEEKVFKFLNSSRVKTMLFQYLRESGDI